MAVTELAPVAPGNATACAHCGLEVPFARADSDGPRFCCGGCEAAWRILHDAGLADYYTLPDRRGEAVTPSGRSYDAFDHPSFQRAHVKGSGDTLTVELYLEGVHCASCVWLVERMARLVPGVRRVELDAGRSRVQLWWDPRVVSLSAIAAALDQIGYRPHPFRGTRAEVRRRSEDRAMLARIGVAGALAGNVMMIALALYSGDASGMEPEVRRFFRWVSLALTAPALLGPGIVFFRGAAGALRARTVHMDVPIALALAAGFVRGTMNTISGTGPIYFDGVTALVFLLLVGRFLQQRAQRAAVDSTELLASLSPVTARRFDGDDPREVPSGALVAGDRIEVRAGETLPADGIVLAGDSELDTSLLTGEPRPVVVGIGDAVNAGTINRAAVLQIRVTESGEDTRIGRLAREVEAGAARRAPIVKLADRMAAGFVAAVLALAVVTWVLWQWWDPARALDQSIALLIVTCPCALALATPLALTAAIGRAARRGILIKGGDVIEQLAGGGTMVFDKTGTLTDGRLSLTGWEGDDSIRRLALALECDATHPAARGFVEAWPGVEVPAARDVRHVPGGGLEGRVEDHRVAVGSASFISARIGTELPRRLEVAGETPVWVAVDGVLRGRARFADRVRAEATEVLARLRGLGWSLEMLSGDDPTTVKSVGSELGIPSSRCQGGASPEAKLAVIEERVARGPVVMVGDGVNDAAAMARASAGISVRGGAEASLAAADVYLARPGLEPLADLVAGSRRTMGVIHRTIALSLVYNLIGATLAISGFVTPLVAAILMPVSSISAILACWLGRTFPEERS